MSNCIRHEACPKCGPIQDGSGDNLGVYDDGHKWCFACGYFVPSSGIISIQDVRARLSQAADKNFALPPVLPEDHTHVLPAHALEWLNQYNLSQGEINQNRMGWSPHYDRIIFPVYDNVGNLLMWQGRYCPVPGKPSTGKRSKYFTQGRVENVLALLGAPPSKDGMVCVVEDFISAIKVARICSSHCLWGSEVSLTRLKRLSLLFPHIILWLDHDKAAHSIKCATKAHPYFEKVSSIYTEKDPKTYSTEELKQWILMK